jgi:undecaprenyl-diphosphatase
MDNVAANVELFRLINSHHAPVPDFFFVWIRWIGTGYVLIPILLLTYIYSRPKLTPLLIAVAVETVVVSVLKHCIHQPRPVDAGIGTVHLLQRLHRGSFPSGDVAMVAAIAFVMCRGGKPIVRIGWYLYVVLIAYERIYLGVHFPIDVTAGAVIGAVCAYLPYLRLRKPSGTEAERVATS